jgi:hypothetical protein
LKLSFNNYNQFIKKRKELKMKKVFKLLKGKEIIYVSLLTLIAGGVGGFFIGKGQSSQLQQNNFQQQRQSQFGQNTDSPDTNSGASTGSSNGQSGNSNDSGTTRQSSDESGAVSA